MSIGIRRKTLSVPELALALGVEVVKTDEYGLEYRVSAKGETRTANRKNLRAIVCELGGDPLDD